MQMIPVRIFFEKSGRAKYTSHLDTMRTISRALKRSGLPVWYTQGFNPHMYSTFSLPIALGYESLCESMDLRLTEEIPHSDVVERLNGSLPPGFRALKAAEPVMDASTITWADYHIGLYYSKSQMETIEAQWNTFLDKPAIEVVKKTKKGEKTVDLKPLAELLSLEVKEGHLQMQLRLASGNKLNINPTLFLGAFIKETGTEPIRSVIVRNAIYNEKMEQFR